MATLETSASWSGTNNGAYWGLTRKIGPYKTTPADVRRANSQAGGPHAGHANWFLPADFHPYIQTKHTKSNTFKYIDSPDVVTSEIYVKPKPGVKIPRHVASASRGIIPGMREVDDEAGIGPRRDKQTVDQRRGYGSGTPEEEKVIHANDSYSFPSRVRKQDDAITVSRKRESSVDEEELQRFLDSRIDRRVNDVLSYQRKSTVNLGMVPEPITQQEIADIYYPVEQRKIARRVLRKRSENKSMDFEKMTEKARAEKRGAPLHSVHKKYETKPSTGKRKSDSVDQNSTKRQK